MAIPLEHIIQNYGAILFYDAPPPLAYLLQVLWDKLFPIYAAEEDFRTPDGSSGPKVRPCIEVEVAQVAHDLRDKFSMKLLNPKLPECPRLNSVREAMDQLTTWGLVEKMSESRYVITYRKLLPGTLEYILKKLAPEDRPKRGQTVSATQLELFRKEIEKQTKK